MHGLQGSVSLADLHVFIKTLFATYFYPNADYRELKVITSATTSATKCMFALDHLKMHTSIVCPG